MRPDVVVFLPPTLREDLRLRQGVEELAIEELVTELAVVAVQGEMFGLIVRARNVFSNVGAQLREVFGGEARGYTKLLSDSRNQAVDQLRDAARERGGNAVLAMRFAATRPPAS